jgi:hypothetical protein
MTYRVFGVEYRAIRSACCKVGARLFARSSFWLTKLAAVLGHYKSQEAIKISFHLVDTQDIRIKYEIKQNSDLCKNQNNPLNKNKLNDCREIKVKACMNVVGPKYIFPKSKSVL